MARRIYGNPPEGGSASRPAVLIAMSGVALGLAVILVAVSVVVGFKREVRDKLRGIASDVTVLGGNMQADYSAPPIDRAPLVMQEVRQLAEVGHVQRYSFCPGIAKTDDAFEGIVLKGVGGEFDGRFLASCLLEGSLPDFGKDTVDASALISRTLADRLHLRPGDRLHTYFIGETLRARVLKISGIYATHFTDFDNHFVLTDIRLVNRLNGWTPTMAGGLEIRLRHYERLEDDAGRLADWFDARAEVDSVHYSVRDVETLNPQVFAWLDLLDLNVWVILFLMTGVAGFTMISGLLILILERTSMIGLLKALGAENRGIRRTFLWLAVFLIGRGMLWGNLLAMAFCVVQWKWGVFSLDPSTYYVNRVPVAFPVELFALVNLGTLAASVLMLLAPSYIIARIRPADSMRYE